MDAILQKIYAVISNIGGRLLVFLSVSGASLNKINWRNPSWDLFAAALFLAAVFLYGVMLGKGRILVMLSVVYMSAVIAIFFPWNFGKSASGANAFAAAFANIPIKLVVFAVVLILLFFLLIRSGLASIFRATTEGSWIETFIFGFLQAGLLAAIIMSFFPPEIIQYNLPVTGKIFAAPIARFIWIILPIAAVAFTKKKRVYKKTPKDPLDLY